MVLVPPCSALLFRWRPLVLGSWLMVLAAATSSAWVRDEAPLWPDGDIPLHINLDGPRSTLGDGRTYDQVVRDAALAWNGVMGRVRFVPTLNSNAPVNTADSNGYNNLTFAATVAGIPFGEGVFAVTLIDYDETRRTETDIVFNSTQPWDAYAGSILDSPTASMDLGRVALHELGHVIGLDHPVFGGGFTIMDPYNLGLFNQLGEEDKDAASELYGLGPSGYVPRPPEGVYIDGDLDVTEGESTLLRGSASRAYRYQWFFNDVAIAGATGTTLEIPLVRLVHGGTYTLQASNVGGSTPSSGALLRVTPARPIVISAQVPDTALEVGAPYDLGPSFDATNPMTFQWYRNGVPLPAERGARLTGVTTRDQAGDYHLVISNLLGTVTTATFRFTVRPQTLHDVPVIASHSSTALSASLYGIAALGFQWYRNGEALPGATGSAVQLPENVSSLGEEYTLVVHKESGSLVSGPAARAAPATVTTLPTLPWRRLVQHGSVLHLLYDAPARVERYDLATRAWLPAVTLPAAAHDLAVAPEGLLVLTSTEVHRYDAALNRTLLLTLPAAADRIFVVGEHLLVIGPGYAATYPRTGGALVFQTFLSLELGELHFQPGTNQLLVRGRRNAALVLSGCEVQPAGAVVSLPFVGLGWPHNLPEATRLFFGPSAAGWLVDDGGTIYRSDRRYAGQLGPLTHLATDETGRVVIARGAGLTLLDGGLEPIATATLGSTAADVPLHLAAWGDGIAGLVADAGARGVAVRWIERTAATALPTAAVPAPAGRAFVATRVEYDREGNVLLLAPAERALHRWSTTTKAFLPSLRLRRTPIAFSYSPELHRVWLGYADGVLTAIDFTPSPVERVIDRSFANLQHVLAVGERVLVWNISRTLALTLLDATGADVSGFLFNDTAVATAFDPAFSRIYRSQGSTVSRYALSSSGSLSDYQGATGTEDPRKLVRVSPDGTFLVRGTGEIYSSAALSLVTRLPAERFPQGLGDVAWLETDLVTGHNTLAGTELTRWSGTDYSALRSVALPGRLLRLIATSPTRVLAVTARVNYLVFTELDQALDVVSSTEAVRPSRLINLSARAWVGTDDQQVIPGFVISGAQPKRVIVRAAGPALGTAGVPGFLANPRLVLYNAAAASLDTNDDWPALPDLAAFLDRGAAVGANPFAAGSRDSGLIPTLAPGVYSAHTSGVERTTGVSVIEVFDADPADESSRLVNISARARVGTGDNVLIVGFVITGEAPLRLLIQGLGPQLAGVLPGTLPNPQLTLYGGGGQVLETNEDWSDTPALRAAWTKIGAGALTTGSKDAALLLDLSPGLYSVILRGSGTETGVGMIELYEVPE